jgi:hypothetical protein
VLQPQKALLLFLITIHDEVCVADAGLLQLKCSMMTDEKCKFVGQEKKVVIKISEEKAKTYRPAQHKTFILHYFIRSGSL